MKKFLVIVAFSLALIPASSYAYIASDSHAGGLTTSTGTLSFNQTVATCDNAVQIIYAFTRDGDLATGATFDGVSATLLNKVNTRNSRFFYAYYLLAPNPGTHTVSITTTGTPGRTEGISVSYCGASTPDAYSSQNSSANPNVFSITTLKPNSWVTLGVDVSSSASASTNSTLLFDNTGTGATMLFDSSSNSLGFITAGSNSMNLLNPASGTNISLMVGIPPFIPGGGTSTASSTIVYDPFLDVVLVIILWLCVCGFVVWLILKFR